MSYMAAFLFLLPNLLPNPVERARCSKGLKRAQRDGNNARSAGKDERVAAYAPIPGLGWGIIATEPAKTVFALRKENLNNLIIRHGLIFLISCLLAYVIVRMINRLKLAEEKIHALNNELQQRADRLEVANKELESFS